MNNKRKLVYSLIILICCFTYDCFIAFNIAPYFSIDHDYIYYIFAAIATVGVLGCTILSSVLCVSDVTCLGFSLKEILRFNNSPIQIQRILVLSIGPIIVAIPVLAFRFYTTISFILIFTAVLIIRCSLHTWQLISNKKLLKKLVINEVKSIASKGTLQNLDGKISCWGKELIIAIENDDKELQNAYLELLYLVYITPQQPEKNELRVKIESIIFKTFPIVVDTYGFTEAYKMYLCHNEKIPVYDEIVSIRKYLSTVRYGDIEQLSSLNIIGKIDNIVNELPAEKNDVVFVLYQFYDAINSNLIINKELKYTILNDYFNSLCYFFDTAKNVDAQSQALLLCFREGVLKNSDYQSRTKLYDLMIDNLYRKNRFWGSNIYINTIAEIFRGAFFYTVYETETVQAKHRDQVNETLQQFLYTTDNIVIKLGEMIEEHSKKILEYYIEDSFNNDFGGIFDYFPDGFGCKSTIWTSSSRIKFAFMFYLVEGYDFYLFPIQSFFESSSVENSKKKSICTSIIEIYDIATEELCERVQEPLSKLQESLGNHSLLPPHFIKDNFNYINDKLIELRKLDVPESPLGININVIQEQLETQLAKEEKIDIDKRLIIKSDNKFQIPPHFNQHYKKQYEDMAHELRIAVTKAMAQILKATLPEVKISFNQNGVNTLLSNLKTNNIKVRNYTFIDDLALSKEVRATDEYKELVEIIRKIDYKPYRNVGANVFLKTPLALNVQVNSYKSEPPTAEECDLYLKSYKIAEGRFNLEGVSYTTQQAIEWVNNSIKVESAIFSVAVSFDETSGFRIEFDY